MRAAIQEDINGLRSLLALVQVLATRFIVSERARRSESGCLLWAWWCGEQRNSGVGLPKGTLRDLIDKEMCLVAEGRPRFMRRPVSRRLAVFALS